MTRHWAVTLLCLLLLGGAALGNARDKRMELAKGARVGILNLLDANLTHYHRAKDLERSFLKTQPVAWPMDTLLVGVAKTRLEQMGLVGVPVPQTQTILRNEEDCFLNNNLGKGLPRDCGPPFVDLATAAHLDAILVLAPGLNNGEHGRRHKDMPDYVRGWGMMTAETDSPDKAPAVFNMTELVLIGFADGKAKVGARMWGGDSVEAWTSFAGPPDVRVLPDDLLGKLAPMYSELLGMQCDQMLGQVDIR